MTVTFVFPWKVNPVPAVQEVSVILAWIVNGEAVSKNALLPVKADCATRQRTVARLVLSLNAFPPILVTPVPIVAVVKLEQYENASLPILCTLLGIVMLDRNEVLNAPSPMLVTPVPIVAVARLVQPSNAPLPILVTLLGMVMLARLEQPVNAFCPMLVTLFPMVAVARLVQSPNALSPMLSTLLGIVMLVRLLH